MVQLSFGRWFAALILTGAAVAMGWHLERAAGVWLVVQEDPERVHAIVVLSGGPKHRPPGAAAAYHAGWAREVWLTQGQAHETSSAATSKQHRAEADGRTRQELLARGVPASAIIVLPERNRNTAEEICTISRHLAARGGGRLIIVTSKSHTRRVKVLWRLLASEHPEAIVLYSPGDRFDASNWWRTAGGVRIVSREYAGIVHAWLTYPLASAL